MEEKEKMTTIAISVSVREKLKELGKKGETYDEIIRRLCDIERASSMNSR